MRLLTVYRSDSPAFHVGDMFVEFDGQHFSSANAGKLAEAGLKFLSSSVTNRSILFDDGLGFEVEAAVEIIQPPRDLLIFGAGDDAIPLVKMAADLGWHVRVVGRRPELANDLRFKKLSDSGEITVYSGPYKLVVKQLSIGGRTDVVVMTHDFEGDVSLLPSLLESSARFIGLLGPKRRIGRIAQRLFESGRGLSDFDIARLRSPVGLDIGATSPDEIAVSIVAELLGNERGRDGGSLHRRQEPLHRRSPLIEIQSVISEPELAVQ
jgi:xanthine/CO dehydrogenase XdhC/CoxF family maturation factor